MGLERAAWLERRYGARIEWRPFYLHPEYPPEGIRRDDLERRYRVRYGAGFGEHVREVILAAGLPVSLGAVVSNSLASLQLGEFARDAGRLDEVHPLLFRAFWAEGRDIGDAEVLTEVAAGAGLDADAALAAVRENRYARRVAASTERAYEQGVSGVPAWVVDGRFLVPGAQPHEVFDRVLERLGHVPLAP